MRWVMPLLLSVSTVSCSGATGGGVGSSSPAPADKVIFAVERAPGERLLGKVRTSSSGRRPNGCFGDFPASVEGAALEEMLRKHVPEAADRAQLLANFMRTLECSQYIALEHWREQRDGANVRYDEQALLAEGDVIQLVRLPDTGREPEVLATVRTSAAALGCTSDSQCKGDRVCQAGSCVWPAPPPSTPSRISPGCTMDSQCKGDRICKNGECAAP